MRYEIIPSDALQSKLMNHLNLNKSKMIDTVKLLLRGFMLYKGGHRLYLLANEIQNVHHLYPGEMHEQPDVVSIKTREPSLAAKIFHDQSH